MEDDAPKPYVSKIDRRTALTWIGIVGAATAAAAGVVVYGPKIGGKPEAKGYGTDPNLVNPAANNLGRFGFTTGPTRQPPRDIQIGGRFTF